MVYVDNAATTRLDNRVLGVMKPYMEDYYFNPSSIYKQSQRVKKELDIARKKIADYIGAGKDEIIFTSGGTESDNLAIKGFMLKKENAGKHIITSNIEHHAVLSTCEYLKAIGYQVTFLKCDHSGMINPKELEDAITEDTVMVSIMLVNNEIGAIQPIDALAEITRKYNIVFHTDAVQGLPSVKLSVNDLGVDMLSISSHKIHGPKGVGALYINSKVQLVPLIHGGQQENLMRGGTESVHNIIGFAKAIELLEKEAESRHQHYEKLRTLLLNRLKEIPDTIINSNKGESVPNIVNVSFKDAEAEGLLFALNKKGICASMGSACNSNSVEPSHVIKSINIGPEYERGTLRLSFGKDNTTEEIEYIADSIKDILRRYRN